MLTQPFVSVQANVHVKGRSGEEEPSMGRLSRAYVSANLN